MTARYEVDLDTRLNAIRDAFDEVCGAALVLDPDLHVVLGTKRAEALLGFPVVTGELAPKLLCGESVKRPVAEALVAGRPVSAYIPRPGPGGELHMLHIRSLPLAVSSSGPRTGWLLLLEDAHDAGGDGPVLFHGMWTQDAAMKLVFRVLVRIADGDDTVLVRGETGAGKELIANALHALSRRSKGPLRVINCAALPPNLLESELFGHIRGAFTGAVRDTPGHMQLADGGTLFLDEVAELPLELQAKLLRVLETRTVIPVGGREPIPIDVRIVSATHRALRKEVEAGRFRADLMYRLRVIPVYLPPLRARRGDIRLLTEKLIESANAQGRRRVEHVAPATWQFLEAHDWPGNIRELRNVLAYAYAIGEGPILAPSDLPAELVDRGFSFDGQTSSVAEVPALSSEPTLSVEAQRIVHVLERTAGNRERAAKILGLSRVTLWRRMRDLGLLK